MLGIHEINAGLVAATLVVWIISAVLLWRPVRGPAWPIAAGAAALVVVFGQLALLYSGVVALHIPLGVAIFGLAVRLTIWAFSYRPGMTTRRRFLGIAGGVAVAALSTTGFVALSGRRVSGGVLPRGATLWYHDHRMGLHRTAGVAGLAGFALLRDAGEDSLPLPAGDRDIPLMICDRSFEEDGSFRYPALDARLAQAPGVSDEYSSGVLGDVILVNGAPWPVLEVDAARYRLRVLNASNARRYQLALNPAAPLVQVGTAAYSPARPRTPRSPSLQSSGSTSSSTSPHTRSAPKRPCSTPWKPGPPARSCGSASHDVAVMTARCRIS
jgi:hypothetical protein